MELINPIDSSNIVLFDNDDIWVQSDQTTQGDYCNKLYRLYLDNNLIFYSKDMESTFQPWPNQCFVHTRHDKFGKQLYEPPLTCHYQWWDSLDNSYHKYAPLDLHVSINNYGRCNILFSSFNKHKQTETCLCMKLRDSNEAVDLHLQFGTLLTELQQYNLSMGEHRLDKTGRKIEKLLDTRTIVETPKNGTFLSKLKIYSSLNQQEDLQTFRYSPDTPFIPHDEMSILNLPNQPLFASILPTMLQSTALAAMKVTQEKFADSLLIKTKRFVKTEIPSIPVANNLFIKLFPLPLRQISYTKLL